MAITDPEAIKFVNEYIRPMCEQIRSSNAKGADFAIKWAGISAGFPNDAAEMLEDGREDEGISRLTGADINAVAPKGDDGKPMYKVSVNDLVIKAVAMALKKVPNANASWAEETIVRYTNVDVSVAVALDGGLITPIVRNADQKSIPQISGEMKDLAGRARTNNLKPEEYQGGGFSISNLGMYGIKRFNAIINPPQACILAIGAGDQRAVVENGELTVATVMDVTLSSDHRVVDGAVGAEFLQAFKEYIERPVMMLV